MKTILTIILILVVLLGGWYFFRGDNGSVINVDTDTYVRPTPDKKHPIVFPCAESEPDCKG